MKKLISVLLVAIMMLVGVVVVYANEAPAAVEYVLTGEIVKDEVHLSFDIANNDVGFAMLIFDMAYNPEAVSFVSVSTDECVLSEPDVDDMSEYGLGNYVYISALSEKSNELLDSNATGNVFKAVFKIVDYAEDFGFAVDVHKGDQGMHVNFAEENVPFTITYAGNAFEEIVLEGWFYIDNKWYFYENGAVVTNQWRKDSQGWCWLTETGAMATDSWVKDSKGWCYVDQTGYCVTNCWMRDSVGWCYLDSEGSQVKNAWVADGGKWYFVDADGYMVSNAWRQDSKGWVWLGSDGAMVTNAWVRDSIGWCYVGSDGYAVTNCWKQDSAGWCYLGSTGSQVKNAWIADGGKWYFVDADGYMVYNCWKLDSNGWCYLGSDGAMVTNAWVQDSNGWCYIGANGYVVY